MRLQRDQSLGRKALSHPPCLRADPSLSPRMPRKITWVAGSNPASRQRVAQLGRAVITDLPNSCRGPVRGERRRPAGNVRHPAEQPPMICPRPVANAQRSNKSIHAECPRDYTGTQRVRIPPESQDLRNVSPPLSAPHFPRMPVGLHWNPWSSVQIRLPQSRDSSAW